MKRALLLVAHGGPRPESAETVWRAVEQLRARRAYDLVEAGFLSFNQPDIPSAVERCVRQGACRIVALPYFLHAGRHVLLDIPRILEQQQARFPQAEILLADYAGLSPRLTEALLERARQAAHDKPPQP